MSTGAWGKEGAVVWEFWDQQREPEWSGQPW